jgi:hypothetical protein
LGGKATNPNPAQVILSEAGRAANGTVEGSAVAFRDLRLLDDACFADEVAFPKVERSDFAKSLGSFITGKGEDKAQSPLAPGARGSFNWGQPS